MGKIGFKTKAAKEEETNTEAYPQDEMMEVPVVIAETINRLENLNSFICSKEFSSLPVISKQQILNDLSYFTRISTIIT